MIKEESYTHEGTLFKVGRFNFLYRFNSSGEWIKSDYSLTELIRSADKSKDYYFVKEFESALLSMNDRANG